MGAVNCVLQHQSAVVSLHTACQALHQIRPADMQDCHAHSVSLSCIPVTLLYHRHLSSACPTCRDALTILPALVPQGPVIILGLVSRRFCCACFECCRACVWYSLLVPGLAPWLYAYTTGVSSMHHPPPRHNNKKHVRLDYGGQFPCWLAHWWHSLDILQSTHQHRARSCS